ncbi:Zn-dependent exopeptidase [Didymella exigua CBS 183.55]|uniref:Zn-dependent exopeptidase n=1 Tax=Didymella exigua CBS 183.55 TaxID=1150837 RepID=A0A6A5RYV0_9PLEO|nr:Zn-dependent exopeptidase [Didymella exigua CBS 183.55]KAF1932793.1 Zn-dependent exopeptidase [Didymella exigua CBS 183.55]
MPDEKAPLHVYERPASPPIPSYEEATSSRHTRTARRGPDEASDDAERQGLLSPDAPVPASGPSRRNAYYHPPSVQSVDDGDSELGSPVRSSADDEQRQILEEMDILDPESADDDGRARRNRARGRFSKRLSSLTSSLSSLHLPRLAWPRRLRPSFARVTDGLRPSVAFVANRLPTVPDEYRPGWSVIARLCGLLVIASLVYMLVASEVVPMGGGFGAQFNAEWVRHEAQKNIEGWRIEKTLEYMTSFDHLAATEGSYVQGQWIEGKFKDAHMDTYTHDEYWVYMNYPQKKAGRSVEVVEGEAKGWKASLEEPSVYKPARAQTPAFHALSAAGSVQGPLIYVNYCDTKDFKRLWDSGVDVQGAVALCREYGTQPDLAMKVKAAQDAGVVGVLVYSDPVEDGFTRGTTWPNGKWRPETSLRRASVALSNMILGDPLTPGKPSSKKQDRVPKDKNPGLPRIPSLPLSWKDGQKLLQSLDGIGEKLPEDWKGAVPDVNWFSGHPDKSPRVNLSNHQDEVEQQRITNVFGSIRGLEDTAHKVIIGNHRDSFCFGAADPGSGTAIMLEVVRVLGDLRAQGWRPMRTIEFASWDAGEYNHAGSTEHVEANADSLRENALAYINIDAAVTGDKLWANGSPIFTHAWHRILDRLNDPRMDNKTLKELWDAQGSRVGNLAADRDSAPFQFIAGTSSLDFGFGAKDTPANPMAGSCYETFDWIAQHIDPGFLYHQLHAQLLVLLILELSQEPIAPLRITNYAAHLQQEGQKLLDDTEKAGGDYDIAMFEPLVQSLSALKAKADEFHKWETFWYNQVYATGGFETTSVTMQRINHNAKMGQFETLLLDLPTGPTDTSPRGLPGRQQFKHVVFAPSLHNARESSVFPFARDALEKLDWKRAKDAIRMTADYLNRAGDVLGPG